MARSRISGLVLVFAVLTLPLAGCHQASVRYNVRYSALLSQPLPGVLPIPVDGVTSSPVVDAVYVTDGTAVYAVTVAATGMVRSWKTPPNATPTWMVQ